MISPGHRFPSPSKLTLTLALSIFLFADIASAQDNEAASSLNKVENTLDKTIETADPETNSHKPEIKTGTVVKPDSGPEIKSETEEAAQPAKKPAPIAQKTSEVTKCDELAAYSHDNDAVSPGVSFAVLKPKAVIKACQTALKTWPDSRRFHVQLARGLFADGKKEQALSAFRKAAEMGSAQAMAFIGASYKIGAGAKRDLVKALSWFERSAEAGNVSGQVFAALMHRDGQGTEKNPLLAAQWLQFAIAEDNPDAMYHYALMLDQGAGLVKDPNRAATLLMRAAKLDMDNAFELITQRHYSLSRNCRKAIQQILQDEGHYQARIDGDFGRKTRAAFKVYFAPEKSEDE